MIMAVAVILSAYIITIVTENILVRKLDNKAFIVVNETKYRKTTNKRR